MKLICERCDETIHEIRIQWPMPVPACYLLLSTFDEMHVRTHRMVGHRAMRLPTRGTVC